MSTLQDDLNTFHVQSQPEMMEAVEATIRETVGAVLPEGEAAGEEIDLKLLAKKVYELLKKDARITGERGGRPRQPW